MRREDREHGDPFLDDVAIAHRVERVREGPVEAQPFRGRCRVELEGRRRERAGAERRRRAPRRPLGEPLQIAGERPCVGAQVVTERHHLCGAAVRGPGHQRVRVLARALDERAREPSGQRVDAPLLSEQPQPEIRHHEVVARPPRVEPGAELGDPVGHRALDEARLRDRVADRAQRRGERPSVVVREQPGITQRGDVCDRGAHVLPGEAEIERERASERRGLERRRLGEPPAPEHAVVVARAHDGAPCFAAHTLSGRPWSRR